MTDESIMPFGKFKGQKLANVPASYLIWLFDNDKCYGELKEYIEENLESLRHEINESKK